MTLPASGPISFNNINVELGVAGTTTASLGQASYRTLAGVPSGAISMSNFYGKSNRVALSYTFASSTANASLNVAAIGGYIAGKSDITITVNSGVYLWASTTGNYGLALSGGTSGDTVTLVNNGFIMGCGGDGAATSGVGGSGGPALLLGFNTTINNTNASAYIGGGGGAGGTVSVSGYAGGGGGAGGGRGGYHSVGGLGGGIGSSGANASTGGANYSGGGGGGRIFAGTGGASSSGGTSGSSNPNGYGRGGGSGGGGGAVFYAGCPWWRAGGGGGGGWGASGGTGVSRSADVSVTTTGGAGGSANASGANGTVTGYDTATGGGAGGKAVNLNGRSVTWVSGNTSRVYGAVS